ncbi:MAG: cytochrome c oxidase subunit 3 [Cyclobacteriaceae bacterium]|nr:cytochrome c oxidase subunit 3 [Cyclobacteriaceae bacterium]
MIANQNLHIDEQKPTLAMHPKKFALWLFIVSIVMLFAALTSAYIVKQSDGNWLSFKLPGIFAVNTVIIAISSLTMHLAYVAAKKDALGKVKWMLSITVVLGLLFLVGQYISWSELVKNDVYFVSNYASASFIYVFTGLHGVHLISGIIFLLIAFRSSLKSEIHSKKLVQIEMCMTYWHFLGGLWLYLYLFLLFNL